MASPFPGLLTIWPEPRFEVGENLPPRGGLYPTPRADLRKSVSCRRAQLQLAGRRRDADNAKHSCTAPTRSEIVQPPQHVRLWRLISDITVWLLPSPGRTRGRLSSALVAF